MKLKAMFIVLHNFLNELHKEVIKKFMTMYVTKKKLFMDSKYLCTKINLSFDFIFCELFQLSSNNRFFPFKNNYLYI